MVLVSWRLICSRDKRMGGARGRGRQATPIDMTPVLEGLLYDSFRQPNWTKFRRNTMSETSYKRVNGGSTLVVQWATETTGQITPISNPQHTIAQTCKHYDTDHRISRVDHNVNMMHNGMQLPSTPLFCYKYHYTRCLKVRQKSFQVKEETNHHPLQWESLSIRTAQVPSKEKKDL
jgi:hypothetical protein